MKMKNKKIGLSLMELLVAIPMIALVFMGIAYMLGITGRYNGVEIAKIKTLTAANNVLMLVKAKGFSELPNVLDFDDEIEITTSTTPSVTIDYLIKSGEDYSTPLTIPLNSKIHPDGVTNLNMVVIRKDAGADAENLDSKIIIVTVIAPDFEDIQTTLKTVEF